MSAVIETATSSSAQLEKSTALLSVCNLTRTFQVRRGLLGHQSTLTAVDAIDLEVHKGQVLGLVGESGCGKSTLGRMLAGLLPPTTGEIFVQGQPLYSAQGQANLDGSIQMIFQDPYGSLNPRLPIGASIAEPLTVRHVPKALRTARMQEMLSLVGFFPEHAKRYPHEFSGGQRQRIAVARALITEPQILICDEPVSALDASVQAQVLNLICDVQERFAPACIFISHDLSVVGFVCPRIAVMYLGRLVEDAPRESLFSHAAHPYTQALLASIPSLDPTQKIDHPPLSGELPSPIHPPTGCTFHPRCPKAMDICQKKRPSWVNIGEKHKVRCHLYNNFL